MAQYANVVADWMVCRDVYGKNINQLAAMMSLSEKKYKGELLISIYKD